MSGSVAFSQRATQAHPKEYTNKNPDEATRIYEVNDRAYTRLFLLSLSMAIKQCIYAVTALYHISFLSYVALPTRLFAVLDLAGCSVYVDFWHKRLGWCGGYGLLYSSSNQCLFYLQSKIWAAYGVKRMRCCKYSFVPIYTRGVLPNRLVKERVIPYGGVMN